MQGARLFNSLPPRIINLNKCSEADFKEALDDYLTRIPDEPMVGVCYLGLSIWSQATIPTLWWTKSGSSGGQEGLRTKLIQDCGIKDVAVT